jgi:hypothetical protein
MYITEVIHNLPRDEDAWMWLVNLRLDGWLIANVRKQVSGQWILLQRSKDISVFVIGRHGQVSTLSWERSAHCKDQMLFSDHSQLQPQGWNQALSGLLKPPSCLCSGWQGQRMRWVCYLVAPQPTALFLCLQWHLLHCMVLTLSVPYNEGGVTVDIGIEQEAEELQW